MMRVTMVKKELASGEPCRKCEQAVDLFKRRGVLHRIDEITVAREADPESPGMLLAKKHNVALAPFFIVEDGGKETVYTSALELLRSRLNGENGENGSAAPLVASAPEGELDEAEVLSLNQRFDGASPQSIIEYVLERYGKDAAIAFSGAEDVALIDMAVATGRPFSVFSLDTGRLHPETYRFIDKVRSHYGIEIRTLFPNLVQVEELVQKKGLFSFYQDGHGECCGIRKVEPLRRALSSQRAWLTGQRRDQSPTRAEVARFQLDRANSAQRGPLLKVNPLSAFSLGDTWEYLRERGAPYNELHDRGYISIGCEPCTRAIRPGEHERAGRWWWEESTKRECGLHT
jgi:phosphoadenosine phosphosulfate reductase